MSIKEVIEKRHYSISPQKLANWDNENRKTPLCDKSFVDVVDFICSTSFQRIVPEAKAFINQVEATVQAGSVITQLECVGSLSEFEEVVLKGLEGFGNNNPFHTHHTIKTYRRFTTLLW